MQCRTQLRVAGAAWWNNGPSGHGRPTAVACRGVGTLYLIRHGQASYGEADYDRLSPRGIEQAQAIGRWAASAGLHALFAGPLRRQQQTAEYAREAAGGRLAGVL